MTELIHSRVRSTMAQDAAILSTFGITVNKALDGDCEMSCQVPAALVNAAGFAHGAVAFSLMDTACAYALGSLECRGVTINANTTYVKGASAGVLLEASVSVMSRTRRVATLNGEVYLREGESRLLAAHGSFVFQLIDLER